MPNITTPYGACGNVTDYGAAKCFSKKGSHIEPITTDAFDCVEGGMWPTCRYNEKNYDS